MISLNNYLDFTSMGCKKVELKGNGPPHFTIQGSMYHRIGKAIAPNKDDAKFMQLYFYDAAYQTEKRFPFCASNTQKQKHEKELKEILNILHACLEKENPFIHTLKTALETTEYNSVEDLNIILHANTHPKHVHQKIMEIQF